MLRLGQIPFLLLLPTALFAQLPGTWVGAGVKANFRGPWSWSLQAESRWQGSHEAAFVDVAVSRVIGEHLEANVQLRTAAEHGTATYAPEYRAAFRLLAFGAVGAGSWEARVMMQEARPWILPPEWAVSPIGSGAARFRCGYTGPWKGAVRWGVNTETIYRDGKFSAQRNRLDWDIDWTPKDRLSIGYQAEWSGSWEHVLRLGLVHDLGAWRPLDQRRERKRLARIPAAASFDATGTPVITVGRTAGLGVCTSEQVHLSEVGTSTEPADFIELYNPTASDCLLTGWRFDDDSELTDWVGTVEVLPAFGCWVAFCEGAGGFSSGLSSNGESVFLANPAGEIRKILLREVPKGSSETIDLSGNSTIAPPTIGRYVTPGE